MIQTARSLFGSVMRLLCFLLVALALASNCNLLPMRAGDYAMEGSAIRNSYAQSGELVMSANYRFLVRASGTNAWIETTSLPPGNPAEEVAATYGGDVYFLKRLYTRNMSIPDEYAAVTARFPSEASDVAQVLFAFLTAGLTPPALLTGSDLPFSMLEETIPEMVKIDAARSANAPGLLTRAAALAPGLLVIPKEGQRRRVPLSPPYSEGYRLWSYETTGTVLFEDLRFPASFSFRRFFPRMDNAEDFEDVSVATEITGNIESVEALTVRPPQLPQPLNRIVKVADFRFAPSTAPAEIPIGSRQLFYYAITNGNWRLRGDQLLETELATMTRIEANKGIIPIHATKQLVVCVLLFGVLLAPVIWLRYSRHTSRQQQLTNRRKD